MFTCNDNHCCGDTTEPLYVPPELEVNPGEPQCSRLNTETDGLLFFPTLHHLALLNLLVSLLGSSTCFMVQVAVITLTQRGERGKQNKLWPLNSIVFTMVN